MKYNDNNWRVELHVHLDGSYRPSTILHFAKAQGVELPSSSSPEEFAEFARVKQPGTLAEFLKNFPLWMGIVAGDRKAIKQTAYDFVEDCARQKIAYVEARFDPMFLAKDDVTEEEVMSLVLEGVREAEKKFGTKCNIIVSMIRERPDCAKETFKIAKHFYGKGVVGIDVAASHLENEEEFDSDSGNELLDEGEVNDEMIQIFQEAERLGMNRTVHAGENGPAKCVETAVDRMKAQRIGHGYSVIQDEAIYQKVKAMNVHFETCPSSSILSGGANPDWSIHPVRRFCKEKINYSLNTDDTIITGRNLSQEYDVCHEKLGLDAGEIVRCNFNAAKSSFLPKEEKEELLQHMRKVLNID